MIGVSSYDPMMLLILTNRTKFQVCVLDKKAMPSKVSDFASQIKDDEERIAVFFVDGLSTLQKMKEEIKKHDVFADYRVVVIDSVDILSKIKNIDLFDVFKDNKIVRIKPEDFNNALGATKSGILEEKIMKEEPKGKGRFEEKLDKLLSTIESEEESTALRSKILNYCIDRKNKRQLFVWVRQALVFGLNEKMFEEFIDFLDGSYGKELTKTCGLIDKSEITVDIQDVRLLEKFQKSVENSLKNT